MSAQTVTRKVAPVIKFDPRPKASLVDVTPAQAAKWLELNMHNRPKRQRMIDAFARDMSAGNWQMTGEPIKFATDGTLLDGQNRLSAVVESGCTVPLLVVRGLDPAAQTVMDTGAKRSSSDALALLGHRNTALLASTARMALTISEHGYSAIRTIQYTTTEIAAFVDEHGELAHYVAEGQFASRHLDASGTVVAYAMWRLYAIDADEAGDFFSKAIDKIGVTAGDPVLAMTRRFAEARRHRETLTLEAQLGIIFRAWNARRTGKSLQRIPITSRNGDVVVPEPV